MTGFDNIVSYFILIFVIEIPFHTVLSSTTLYLF